MTPALSPADKARRIGRQWITWEPRGRDPYTNPRARRAHYADPTGGPTACGRWVPDDFDAIIHVNASAPRCKRCAKATT